MGSVAKGDDSMTRRIGMLRAGNTVLIAVCALATPLSVAAQYSKLEIPSAADGYSISTQNETSTDAPEGYVGRIEKIDHLAVGREPAVIGRMYKSHFTFANEIRKCPMADGTAEGDGELTVGGTFTHTVGSTTYASSYEVSAKAKYKGKVGDDGFLDGPVTADVDFTFTITPGSSARIDPISPAPVHDFNHITVQFQVARTKILEPPKIGTIIVRDPTIGHISEAYTMAYILSYWGGVWYTFAQLDWQTPNNCVQIAFDPPSNSRQPVPLSQVKVNGYIKTKAGEGVRGIIEPTAGYGGQTEATVEGTGESVSITSSSTDPESPAIFYYTAPKKKLPKMGFRADATSRGGSARAFWETGLGTNWSGQITARKISPGVDKASDLITSHHSEATQITVNVRDGFGTADGYSEIHDHGENRQYVHDPGGGSHMKVNASGSQEASVLGQVNATANVVFDTTTSRYSISVTFFKDFPPGKSHTTSCAHGDCTSRDEPYSMPPILVPMGGKYSDLLHVSGSMDLGKSPAGFTQTAGSYIVTWDLSRTGTTK
jgi:hypothetical protein